MPTPSTFYYNSTVFCDATDIWTDNDLTTPAPDGWYQVGEVYRQKTGGVLGPCHACPSCGPGIVPCATSVLGQGGQGVYRLSYDAGTDVGACVVKFHPVSVPDMLTLTYDGVASSEYSSSVHGYKEGYIGLDTAGASFTPPLLTGSPGGPYPNVDSYVYDPTTTNFLNTGGTETIPQVPGSDVSLTGSGYSTPNNLAWSVIPKTDPTVPLVECVVYGPSPTTQWGLTVFCPRTLNKFTGSRINGGACSPINLVDSFWTVFVGGSFDGVSNMLGVNDIIFYNANGTNPVPSGIYPIVDGDGVTKCVTVVNQSTSMSTITNISAACAGTC